MRDPEIRAGLIGLLRREHPDESANRIWPEMSIGLGASRVDVGLVNGQITGYEIKSAADRLDRLETQVPQYSSCLNHAALVVTPTRVGAALTRVPEWWGVISVHPGADGEIEFAVERDLQSNPNLDPFAVAQLLWREEALEELRALNLHHGLSRATRWEMWDRLAELPAEDLGAIVRRRLKARLRTSGS